MIDKYGRKIEYLRISVTDRCNLRCIYCMPKEGVCPKRHEDILTYDEIVSLVKIFVRCGVTRIKITGGEPLVRKDVSSLIAAIKKVPGIEQVTLTTNGILLEEQLPQLIEAGLDGVNISIDTLDEKRFETITRCRGRGQLERVKSALEAALSVSGLSVKINCVPMEGINETDCVRMLHYAETTKASVRFIEMMPIGLGAGFNPVPEARIKQMIGRPLMPLEGECRPHGSGPCRYFRPEGYRGSVGFISAVSHKFCETCNRVRLTSDGFLKTCLQYSCGTDLREILRSQGGEVDIKLERAIKEAVNKKPKEHHFEAAGVREASVDEDKKMFQIGG